MFVVALRMLFGDATKCLGLVFGVALSTLLLCQQVSIFFGLLSRAASVIDDIPELVDSDWELSGPGDGLRIRRPNSPPKILDRPLDGSPLH
ncbi:MAG: hypothetical protein HQ464_06080 [Planctomycetes bacterium]|nr:hypothetical protein [Planctomycetota bacterium]